MSLFGNTGTGGSLFGNQPTNQQTTGTSLFGGTTTTTANTGTNLFGNTNQQNNSTTNTGLFGGQTNNQQNSGTGLFGSTNTGGGLFGNTNTNNQNTTTGGGLFSNTTTTNTNGTSLFGNTNTNQQNNQGTGLFGNTTTTNTNTGGGLFGNTTTTNQGTSLFGNTQNKPTTIFGNSTNNQQSTSLFGTTVFTPSNLFKYFLYTKIPYGTDGRVYNQYAPYVRSEDGTTNCIDYNLWLKATQENKNPQTTFPTQISSPKQFVSRLKMNEVQLLSVLEKIVKMQKNLESLNIKCGNEIDTELHNAREKMKKIKNLLTLVSTKMAKLGIRTGKVDKNVAVEKKIEEKLVHIASFTNEGSEINRKINMLRNASLENTTIEQDETNYMKDMNKIRIDRNINVLRQMKQIIDSQFSNLNKNIKIINGIQNDLNQLNRYGKIK